jgi:dihydroorotate dehydrogenase electron transfer subunit
MNLTSLPQPFRIVDIRIENSYTKTFTLAGSLAARPGQFVMAWLPGLEDKPFSLAQADPLRLTIAAVGPLSRAFHQLQRGDSIWVRGPLGRGYDLPIISSPAYILLIGGGYGVAPLLFLAQEALASGYQVSAIIGARSAPYLLLVEDFQAAGAAVRVTTEDGSAGLSGLVTDAIPYIITSSPLPLTAVYTCGPTGMLQAVAAFCEAREIPVQVAWEAHMRCGIGLCGSCEVGQGWLTCLDGPVFPFDPVKISPLLSDSGSL